MSISVVRPFKTCFIAAPVGLDLGALPQVLAERQISWEWAKDAKGKLPSPKDAIFDADFLIAIFDGTRSDSNVFFETGIAAAYGKPALLISTKRWLLSTLSRYSIARIPLKDSEALRFHLDIFLKTPSRTWLPEAGSETLLQRSEKSTKTSNQVPASELERRVFDIVVACGGTAVAQPSDQRASAYRPDLLAWLGHQDAELFDPTVIEVKDRVAPEDIRRIEERLVAFMQASGIRSAFVLSLTLAPKVERQLSPYIYWLSIGEFEELTRQSRLGEYVRDIRNRVMHGAR